MRFDEGDWHKAEILRVLPHRAYQLKLEDGSTRRRTLRHVTFSSEPPSTFDLQRRRVERRANVNRPTTAVSNGGHE